MIGLIGFVVRRDDVVSFEAVQSVRRVMLIKTGLWGWLLLLSSAFVRIFTIDNVDFRSSWNIVINAVVVVFFGRKYLAIVDQTILKRNVTDLG